MPTEPPVFARNRIIAEMRQRRIQSGLSGACDECEKRLPIRLHAICGEIDMDYPYDLGPYSRKITTTSADAQRWFDRGLNWCFGYHHEEAVACFEKALAADPSCAMAHWGVGYAAG